MTSGRSCYGAIVLCAVAACSRETLAPKHDGADQDSRLDATARIQDGRPTETADSSFVFDGAVAADAVVVADALDLSIDASAPCTCPPELVLTLTDANGNPADPLALMGGVDYRVFDPCALALGDRSCPPLANFFYSVRYDSGLQYGGFEGRTGGDEIPDDSSTPGAWIYGFNLGSATLHETVVDERKEMIVREHSLQIQFIEP